MSYKTFSNSALQHRQDFYNYFEKVLSESELDAVIFPTYLSTPLKSGRDSNGVYWDAQTQVFINNCRILSPSASLPEISLPIGYHSSGAGIGLEIATLKNNEQLLLDMAYSYTERYDKRVVPAGAPDIYAAYNRGSLDDIIEGVINANKQEDISDDVVADISNSVKLQLDMRLIILCGVIAICIICLIVFIVIQCVKISRRAD